MPGGLLNLISYGNQNIMINGNPTKTMFKTTYAKHTNFGLQKFRIDYEGSKILNMTSTSHFDFKVPRYGDLLMDTYLVVQLPHIWSKKKDDAKKQQYEFKWIKNLGTQMIERVRFTIGGQTIQEYTGQYLTNMVERDFDDAKKKLYYNMTGNIEDFYDPESSYEEKEYPHAMVDNDYDYVEPSIRGRKLYIPLNIWFTLSSKMAFPLTALQYNELHIEIDIRPVKDLFIIKTYDDDDELSEHKKPDFNSQEQQLYNFIEHPYTNISDYKKNNNWNNDIHLISTYAFLTDEEAKVFAENSQEYLIKQVYQHDIHNITGSQRSKIETNGLVSNFMWYFQRSDVNKRNEWSNYTNWEYDKKPKLEKVPLQDGDEPYYKTTMFNDSKNEKMILKTLAIIFDGKYRENPLDEGVFNYVEKYARTSGNAPDGLYFYNFGIKTNSIDFQPMGAVNLSKFKDIEFEWNIMTPQSNSNPEMETNAITNNDGKEIGTIKNISDLYKYTYSLVVFEERYNILSFMSGNANLKYSR